MTIVEAINNGAAILSAAGITNARLDVEVLLAHSIRKDRVWLITHRDDILDERDQQNSDEAIRRRAKHEPLQHILGKQEFWGLEFMVTPDVLIPRPETELVVESALALIKDRSAPLTIVDLCTGSGCIAISLAKELIAAHVIAIDSSERALAVARENARRHAVSDRIRYLEGDLFGPLRELDFRGRIDIIASNPPYIRSGDLGTLQPEVRDFEPEMALIAGPEGTEFAARIIQVSPEYLKKNGALIMEMGLGQPKALTRMVRESGSYDTPKVLKDLAGIERVIVAKNR